MFSRLGWRVTPMSDPGRRLLLASLVPPQMAPLTLYKGCRVISRAFGLGTVQRFERARGATPGAPRTATALDSQLWPVITYESGETVHELPTMELSRSVISGTVAELMVLPIQPALVLPTVSLLLAERFLRSHNASLSRHATLEPCVVSPGAYTYALASHLRLLLRYTPRPVLFREVSSLGLLTEAINALGRGWVR
jgi:hypothetical protein